MASSEKAGMSWMRRWKRKLVMGTLVAAMPAMVGCYGDFPLTAAVYEMNGRVENTVVEQVVFWAFVILPVYGGAMFIDAVVFNLVDFWFDEDVDFSEYQTPDGNTVTIDPSADGDQLVVTVSSDEEILEQMTFVRMEDHIEARDMDGNHVGNVLIGEDGSIQLTDENGNVVRTVSAATIGAAQS